MTNRGLEQKLVSCIANEPERAFKFVAKFKVTKDCFRDPNLKKVFGVALQMRDEKKPINKTSLCTEAGIDTKLIENGETRSDFYCDMVRHEYDKRNAPPKTTKPDRRVITSPKNGKKGGRKPAPPAHITADVYIHDRLTTPDGFLTARHYRDSWHRFDNGWYPVSDLEMEKGLLSYMHECPELARFAVCHTARNILHNMAAFTFCGIKATVEKPCWLSTGKDARQVIAFSNGIAIDVWNYAEQLARGETPDKKFIKVTPDLFSADFVSYDWNPAAKPVLFFKYLNRVMPDPESFEAVRRMLGLLLCDTGKYQVFWQLYGNGANGKTVLLDIIEKLVGRRNVCRVALESLAPGTRFQSFPLATAKVNLCGEMATDLGHTAYAAIEGQLKHAVSGGTIEIERKGVDKEEARCRARFVMAGNSLPTFFDKSNAIWRRLRIIPFNVQIPEAERDPDLAAQIISEEMPAIVVWALEGLAEVIKLKDSPSCPNGAALKGSHRATCDHERCFIAETHEAGNDADRIKCADLYRSYTTWMIENGYRALGASKFAARIQEIFPSSKRGAMRIYGDLCKAYSGIKPLEEFAEIEELEEFDEIEN